MRTAHIKANDSRNTTRYATITEKSDGKFTISIASPRSYSSASNFQIKRIANHVIDANFIHEAVYSLVDSGVTNTSKLVVLLQEHSQDLKTTFLEMTKAWAIKNFEKSVMLSKRTYTQWLEHYNVLVYPANVNKVPNWTYSTEVREYYKRNATMNRVIGEVNRIVKLGEEGYIAKELEIAERHYNDSIIKLASRLKQKGVDENTELDITSGRVGMNFECTINHNGRTTRAYTIIASGIVQQPHYRYLVK